MPKVQSTHIVASAPTGDSAPDSISIGGGFMWIEYGDGAPSTGGGTSTVVQYTLSGQVVHKWTVDGLADGLKYDPITGDVWVLNNNDANANLQLINPATEQLSAPMYYAAPYVYGANSSRGYDDVVFDGDRVFLSYTNPANPGDPVIQEMVNGTAPFGKLETVNIVDYGDEGTNLVTGKLAPLPVTDPDSLKLLPNGDLLLTGEADHSYIFVKDPGTAAQSLSFVTLPAGDIPDDAIMPATSAGTFYISNQGGNDIVSAYVTGLNKNDLYADISNGGTGPNANELVQIDPRTGKVTPVLTGLDDPHGLTFVPAAATTAPTKPKPNPDPKPTASTPTVLNTHIVAVAPGHDSAPDSISIGGGFMWIEYGDGAPSTAGGTSTVVQYTLNGQIVHTWTADGLADGLKYDPVTGDVWVLNNNDANANLQLINPATEQLSGPMYYAPPYVYGADSSRGFDDVVFYGSKVFMSYTNPANPGDPVVVQLLNGTAPFGKLEYSAILSYGDEGINLATGKLAPLPVTDPDSLKSLPNGELLLTGEADHSYIFIKDPGSPEQSASFITLPAGDIPDDAIMPTAAAGTFYISNQGGNDIISAYVKGLNLSDLYADITNGGTGPNANELVQIDPSNGKVTPILTGLDDPHGLAFVPAVQHIA